MIGFKNYVEQRDLVEWEKTDYEKKVEKEHKDFLKTKGYVDFLTETELNLFYTGIKNFRLLPQIYIGIRGRLIEKYCEIKNVNGSCFKIEILENNIKELIEKSKKEDEANSGASGFITKGLGRGTWYHLKNG